MNVQLVSDTSFSLEQIQKQAASQKSSEVCLSIDIKYTCGRDIYEEHMENESRSATYCGNSVRL